MAEKRKWDPRASLLVFFNAHRMGCILAAALVLAGVALTALRPPMRDLRGSIPREFIEACGTRYAFTETNLLVAGAARGSNVNTGEARTFIGFAGKIIRADVDGELKKEIGALQAAIDAAKRTINFKNAKFKQSRNPADKPTQADYEALKQAKAAMKAPAVKPRLALFNRQKAVKNAADIILWMPALADGSKITIALTITSVLAGLMLGVFLALGKIAKFKPLSRLCSAYIFFFRGTPLLMQLFFVYYGLPMISPALAINDKFTAAFVAFTLNMGAYAAEIIRAAIQSIDKGQFEASYALGFSYAQTMRLIVIPQSVRRLIPPVANEFIMALKDASLVALIALADLTQTTRAIASSSASVLVFVPAMVLYLIITAFFTFIFNRLEKRFSIHL
jgi:polar amino acid transport system permease protein